MHGAMKRKLNEPGASSPTKRTKHAPAAPSNVHMPRALARLHPEEQGADVRSMTFHTTRHGGERERTPPALRANFCCIETMRFLLMLRGVFFRRDVQIRAAPFSCHGTASRDRGISFTFQLSETLPALAVTLSPSRRACPHTLFSIAGVHWSGPQSNSKPISGSPLKKAPTAAVKAAGLRSERLFAVGLVLHNCVKSCRNELVVDCLC